MVRIITDSASDFEPDEIAKLSLYSVPLSVSFGDATYQENVNLSKKMFYHLLEREPHMPRTSQPSPQAFLSVLQEVKEAGDQAVVITMSSALSGTYQGAVLAKNTLDFEECFVVDSLTATAGERLLVETALNLRSEGKTAAEIAEALEALRTQVSLYACMDTLKYLRKGGRLSGATYLVGSMMNIKPILHVSPDGRAEIPAKVRGVRKGMHYLINKLKSEKVDSAYPLYIVYTGSQENGVMLAAELQKQGFSIPPQRIVPVGAVVGAHIGPNAFGIVYVSHLP